MEHHHLEYAVSVWNFHTICMGQKADILKLSCSKVTSQIETCTLRKKINKSNSIYDKIRDRNMKYTKNTLKHSRFKYSQSALV
ncbi:hypothetical protein BpHYR1_021788 [Brachionus plicatilis]|uniref:Uncharacterized protein n=1 Tax=Brachionus plicatilis TaxID=10195 RepID=A0A3M7P8D0_BRAPC|nr:hypothetical protein BpHYR1_021788 [Brachionus plicatilis]